MPTRPASGVASAAHDGSIRYGRDIRPILSDRCFLCHGPDRAKQQAGLRLDSFEDATAMRAGGGAAIVPGSARESLAVARILSRDADEAMPPPDSGKHALSAAARALIVRWIDEGARYEPHWAFVPPQAAAHPAAGKRRIGNRLQEHRAHARGVGAQDVRLLVVIRVPAGCQDAAVGLDGKRGAADARGAHHLGGHGAHRAAQVGREGLERLELRAFDPVALGARLGGGLRQDPGALGMLGRRDIDVRLQR
ncbi:MAG: c-type cytochrome domain-containing protein, partial [Phycisphaerales bacterium]